MKVIGRSNFDDDTVDDYIKAENVTQEEGDKLAKQINDSTGEHSKYYYVVVPDDYVLKVWEP